MDENLTEGGDSLSTTTTATTAQAAQAQTAQSQAASRRSPPAFIHMKRWVRTPKVIIMQLDNCTLQVTADPGQDSPCRRHLAGGVSTTHHRRVLRSRRSP